MMDGFVCNQCIIKDSTIESLRAQLAVQKDEYRKLAAKYRATDLSKLERLDDQQRYPGSGYD